MSDRWAGVACLWAGSGFGTYCAVTGIRSNESFLAGIGAVCIVAGVWAFIESRRS
jgi:hypothetical protein